MNDEVVIRAAENGWIVMRYGMRDDRMVVCETLRTDADDVLWDVIEAFDMPIERTNEQGERESLVCYYRNPERPDE